MRDILFRGKYTDNREWIYGSLIIDPDLATTLICGFDYYTDAEGLQREEFCLPVIPATIGQYTGLTDKNGNKIFEGDIVDCWSEGVNAQGTVQQRRDGLWIIYPAWQKHIMWGLCPDEYSHTTVKVIGNIHDNPELLKGE